MIEVEIRQQWSDFIAMNHREMVLNPTAEDSARILHDSQYAFSVLPDGMEPCGKFWYVSRQSATERMATMEPDPNRGPGYILNVYFCFDCDGFHIGHTKVRAKAVA